MTAWATAVVSWILLILLVAANAPPGAVRSCRDAVERARAAAHQVAPR